MHFNRRHFIGTALATGAVAATTGAPILSAATTTTTAPSKRNANPIGVSTYSYWRYRKDTKLPIEDCIDLAAEAGFDAVEILHVQMTREDNDYLQMLKQRAFVKWIEPLRILHAPKLRFA